MTFKGRIALITGASSGVGREIALRAGAAGAHVVVSSHSKERAQLVAEDVVGNGGEASIAIADLLDPSAPARLIDEVVRAHGRIDHLVASGAGATPQGLKFSLFHKLQPSDLLDLVHVHWLSKAYLIRAALDHMIPAGYGKIINISSDAGRTSTPNESMIGGSAAGLMRMSQAIAREVGRYGVRINTISCGPLADQDFTQAVSTYHDILPEAAQRVAEKLQRRMLFPVTKADLADAVLFLLDGTGDNITGQNWSINGGVSTP